MSSCVLCSAHIQRDISIGFVFSVQAVEESVVCIKCLNQFERLDVKQACSGCYRKQEDNKQCQDCEKWRAHYESFLPNHKALFTYNEVARQFMNHFKFQGDVVLGKIFKEVIGSHLKPYTKTHTIVPVPLSQRGKETRGFNQVEVLLKQANIPYKSPLTHIGRGEKQSSKNKEERLQTSQPFELNKQTIIAREKPVLLVDDVYTTGRTLYHARELLETIGKTESFSLFR